MKTPSVSEYGKTVRGGPHREVTARGPSSSDHSTATSPKAVPILTFPFGRPVERVAQEDRCQKRVFVLGVYGSAVHARWLAEDGSTLIEAVAVASEPEVFWRGQGAEAIVSRIELPTGAGRLSAATENSNGPSGIALDKLFLEPLGLERSDAWLCDLVPHSCKNDRQAAALRRAYDPLIDTLGLPPYRWPSVPTVLADAHRRAEIAAEVAEAAPDVLITLGDQPLKWFASYFGAKTRLGSYGEGRDQYGRLHEVRVGQRTMTLLPLAHPRQVARLGSHSALWAGLHEHWVRRVAPDLLVGTATD